MNAADLLDGVTVETGEEYTDNSVVNAPSVRRGSVEVTLDGLPDGAQVSVSTHGDDASVHIEYGVEVGE